jgi:hypothetical protein
MPGCAAAAQDDRTAWLSAVLMNIVADPRAEGAQEISPAQRAGYEGF